MQHGEPRHRPGERYVRLVQAARLTGSDPGRLSDDHPAEFQALGQRDTGRRGHGSAAGTGAVRTVRT